VCIIEKQQGFAQLSEQMPDMPINSQQVMERKLACDSRYRSIIGQLDAMIELVRKKPGADLTSELDRLLDVMMEHIGSENRCMELVGFPQVTQHRLHHQFLWVNTAELICRFGKGLDVLPDELVSIRLLWMEHIHVQDQAFAAYLAS
jgi:hemerythrin